MEPVQLPELRRSSRVKTKTKPGYIPRMTGSKKYVYLVAQLEKQHVLNPDAYQEEPDVVAMVMTQLSLKAGLKAWGAKAHTAAHNEIKQLHLRNRFKLFHWKDLTHEQYMFLKEKRDGTTKARTVVAGGNKQ
jgi:hypothetical protein